MPSSSRRTRRRRSPTARGQGHGAAGQRPTWPRQATGVDFRTGEVLLGPGRRLGPREVSLAAAMGHGKLPVRRRPRVAVISTGDELLPPGRRPGPARSSPPTTWASAALAEAAGAETSFVGIARDTRESLETHFARAADADVIVTIGGASVGDHDLVGPVLKSRGMTLSFWNIAMRPGKPLMFGRLGAARVLGLPGNPCRRSCVRACSSSPAAGAAGPARARRFPAARPAPAWRSSPTARASTTCAPPPSPAPTACPS